MIPRCFKTCFGCSKMSNLFHIYVSYIRSLAAEDVSYFSTPVTRDVPESSAIYGLKYLKIQALIIHK